MKFWSWMIGNLYFIIQVVSGVMIVLVCCSIVVIVFIIGDLGWNNGGQECIGRVVFLVLEQFGEVVREELLNEQRIVVWGINVLAKVDDRLRMMN